MDLKKERLMILDLIAEGKITAEQGEPLFKALDASVIEETDENFTATPFVAPVSPVSPVAPVSPVSPIGMRHNSPNMNDLVAALREAGIDHVTLSDLQEVQVHNITPEYVREMLAVDRPAHPEHHSHVCA